MTNIDVTCDINNLKKLRKFKKKIQKNSKKIQKIK